jgi:xanthine dehydrogenase accessory factor
VAELFACTSNNWIGEFSVSTSIYQQFTDYIRNETPVALATIIEGPGVGAKLLVARVDGVEKVIGSLGHPELDRVVARDTAGELEAGRTGVRHYGPEGQATPEDLIDTPTVVVFIESFSPAPQMWIFGAVDFTAALGRVAKVLGYRVTVCDAREIFATKRRFPMADEVMVTWPTPMFEKRGNTLGPRDAVCILTHDPKFDVPAVQGALSTSVGYIGVMGSRKTHNKRLERLAEVGVNSPEQLSRLMSPIGLDLGGRTPEETAIAICAEIIARRTGHSATSLKNTDGAIHS